MPDADPRAGLVDWLRSHWPPALVWAAPWLRPLARYHAGRHGWDGYQSACLLASVEAWDVWEPERATFDRLVLLACRSRLRDEVKHLRRPALSLWRRDVTDHRRDPTAEVDTRDAADACRRLAPHAAPTLAAVADSDTMSDAAHRLRISRQGLYQRLRAVRVEIGERVGYAETDVGEGMRGDVVVGQRGTS